MTALTDAYVTAQAALATLNTAITNVGTYIASNPAAAALTESQADNTTGVGNFETLAAGLTAASANLAALVPAPAV